MLNIEFNIRFWVAYQFAELYQRFPAGLWWSIVQKIDPSHPTPGTIGIVTQELIRKRCRKTKREFYRDLRKIRINSERATVGLPPKYVIKREEAND